MYFNTSIAVTIEDNHVSLNKSLGNVLHWSWSKIISWHWPHVIDPNGSDHAEQLINSLAPGRSWCDFRNVIFNIALLFGILKSSYANIFRWMPQDLTDDKSTLVQVMAWCRRATSHYLNRCWPRSPTLYYDVTMPQWVKMGGCFFALGSYHEFMVTLTRTVIKDASYLFLSTNWCKTTKSIIYCQW